MDQIILAALFGTIALVWWATRSLRRDWYPRFMIGGFFAALAVLMLAAGTFNTWYDSETVNRGEFD